MFLRFILVLSCFQLCSTSAAVSSTDHVQTRALPDSPSGNYSPATVSCPQNRPTIRLADSISEGEASWLRSRQTATRQPLLDFLARASIPGFHLEDFRSKLDNNDTDLPRVAIALSGGGYRALMNGAGFLSATDDRTPGSTSKGGIGGLLQATTYLAGLSGGSWLVGSIYANNFTTVSGLQAASASSSTWNFQSDIFRGPKEDGLSALNTAKYWAEIATQVSFKAEGWETSLTDYWGRALSYQLIGDDNGGPAYTLSSIAHSDNFRSGLIPFPIIVSDSRAQGEKIISLNSTVYEFNPFEMGSWDPTTYGFAPTRYLGSNFTGGVVPQDGSCVEGFDQAGFVMGTSSTLFNQFLLQDSSSMTEDLPEFVNETIFNVLGLLNSAGNDVAQYSPNPFLGWLPETNINAGYSQLTLVDGGEDLQNIPLHPLIQPARAVDVIFAVDSSADTPTNWPDGTALRAAWDRSASPLANGTLFPAIPDEATFVNLGLNNRPAFFGCDSQNFTLHGNTLPPLLVYVPNAPYVAPSNVTTFTASYKMPERDAIIRNGYEAATQGNSTLDANWPICVGCAVLTRSLERAGTALPDACAACFERYCWNGTLDQRPVTSYEPEFLIGNILASESVAPSQLIVGTMSICLGCAVALILVLAMS